MEEGRKRKRRWRKIDGNDEGRERRTQRNLKETGKRRMWIAEVRKIGEGRIEGERRA